MIVDSHCHLDDEKLSVKIAEVVENANKNNVKYMLTVATNPQEFKNVYEIAQKFDCIFCSYGIHPHEASKTPEKSEMLNDLSKDKVVAVGECGLDYFYNNEPKEIQIKSFETQIELAQELNLPLIIHSRDADDDMIEILEKHLKIKPFKAVFHCFSSSLKLANFAVKHNFYVSASGIITFKKSTEICDIFKDIPNNLLLVETDSPYLAPIPFRGKVNEPALTLYVLEKLAEIKNISPNEMAEITTNNFFKLFNKAKR